MTSKWVIVNLAQTLNSKFEKDWQQIPIAARRAWARTILTGVIAVFVTLFVLVVALESVTGNANHFGWEERVLRRVDAGPISFGGAVWLQTFGADFMLVFVVVTAAGLAVWHERPLLGVSILLSLVIADAVVRIGWLSLERHRPDIIAQGVASLGFHSFPSGHTAKTVTVYGLLAAQWAAASRSGAEKFLAVGVAALIAVIVPFGRLRMGVHWPTDLLGGYVLGGVWLMFLLRALRKASTVAR